MKKQKKFKKRQIKKGELEELEKIIKPEEGITLERTLKLQYSKQFFVRFPREIEELLGLEKGKKIKFIIKIPPVHKEEKVDIQMEVVE